MKQPRNTLKTYFQKGKKPTEEQFSNTLDSFVHKDDAITIDNVSGLKNALDGKLEKGTEEVLLAAFDQKIKEAENIVNKSYLGIAVMSSTPPAFGSYWYKVEQGSIITFTNLKDATGTPIETKAEDFENNGAFYEVTIEVKDGIAQKERSQKPSSLTPTWSNTNPYNKGSQVIYDNTLWEANSITTEADVPGVSSRWIPVVKGAKENSKVFDSGNDVNASTMRATFNASDVLFDQAVTKKAGFTNPLTFGYGTTANEVSSYSLVRVNDTPSTIDGIISEITLKTTTANADNVKFCILEKVGASAFKTIKVFTVSGFTPNAVSTVVLNETINIATGYYLGIDVDGRSFSANITTGNCLSLPTDAAVEGSTNNATYNQSLSWCYDFKVIQPKLTGDQAINILEGIRTNGVATMKDVHNASDVLFDEAITKKAGFTDPLTFGFGTDSNSVSNYNVVRVIDVPATISGIISEITLNASTANADNVKFCILRKTTGLMFKTIKIFTVSGFTPNAVSTVVLQELINIEIGDRLGVYVDNRNFKYNSALGNSLNFSPTAMVEGAETGANVNAGISWCYTFKVKQAKLTGDDAVRILTSLNNSSVNSKIYYLEDYGAVALNPFSPDNSIDCTSALQSCIDDIFADNNIVNAKIALKGMYRIGGPIKTWPNGKRAQIMFPVIDYTPLMVIKNVAIVGEHAPIWEEQSIAEMPVSYGGCGFYSSIYNQDTTKTNWCISLGAGRDSSVFGEFNNINMYMDNIYMMLRSHGANGAPVSNTMSGIDASTNSNFQFGRIFIRTSVPGSKLLMPSANSFGLYLPKWNNHASIDGTYVRCQGFGTGLYATEHLELGKYIGSGNVNGIHCEKYYPINIGQLILEMNKNPIVMGPGAYLNANVYQTERINDSSKWWYSTKDIIQESGTSSVTINRYVVHQEGGQMGFGSWDAGVRVKVINDEHNLSYMPANVWDALPSNPTDGLEGYLKTQKIKVVYLGGWLNANTMQPLIIE